MHATSPNLSSRPTTAAVAPTAATATDSGVLFQQYATLVARFARALLRSVGAPATEVDDIVQDVFMVAHRRRECLESVAAVRAWLYTITRFTVMGYLRRGRRMTPMPLDLGALPCEEDLSQPLDVLERQHHTQQTSALVAELRPTLREVFTMCDLQGLPREEAAEALGLTPGNLSVRLHRARQELRRRLEEAAAAGTIDATFLC